MGEEAKVADVKEIEAPKQEEIPTTEQNEDKKEKKEEAKPSIPLPTVLFVDLHCIGCAKKIERSILKCKGVEKVEMKIEKNEVTVKGIVDPQALCSRIQKKTSRTAKVLSPLPPTDAADSTKAEPPASQEIASGIATVELLVNMHCEACAQQLRKRIMKMSGVQEAETDLTAKKVTVTGTMNGDKLVEYIYRRTGKIALIILPPPPQQENKDGGEKKAEDSQKPPAENKEDAEKKESEDKKLSEGNKEENPSSGADEPPNKEETAEAAAVAQAMRNHEEMAKRMMYWNAAAGYMMNQYHDDEMYKRMMMMHHWMPTRMPMPTTMYAFDRPLLLPPPQIFSDENPNACSIS